MRHSRRSDNSRTPSLSTLLRRELEARQWGPEDLVEASNTFFSSLAIQGLLEGKESLTEDSARVLEEITGMSSESWLALPIRSNKRGRK